jgi:hypothetical protein
VNYVFGLIYIQLLRSRHQPSSQRPSIGNLPVAPSSTSLPFPLNSPYLPFRLCLTVHWLGSIQPLRANPHQRSLNSSTYQQTPASLLFVLRYCTFTLSYRLFSGQKSLEKVHSIFNPIHFSLYLLLSWGDIRVLTMVSNSKYLEDGITNNSRPSLTFSR